MYASRPPAATGRIRLRRAQIRSPERSRPATTVRDLKNLPKESLSGLGVILGTSDRRFSTEELGFQEQLQPDCHDLRQFQENLVGQKRKSAAEGVQIGVPESHQG